MLQLERSAFYCKALVTLLGVTASSRALPADPPPPEATEQWSPVPPVVTAAPNAAPSDAVALFSGTSLDAWEKSTKQTGPIAPSTRPWKLLDGTMVIGGRRHPNESEFW